MTQPYISALSREEQHALALCGITRDAQLAGADPERLHNELNLAAQMLQSATAGGLSLDRLQRICQEARERCNVPSAPHQGAKKQEIHWDDLPLLKTTDSPSQGKPTKGKGKATKGIDRHHAAHPSALFFSALFLILLVIATAGIAVLLGYGAIFGELPTIPIVPAAGIYVLLWVCYILSIIRARCVICRGIMCSLFTSKRSIHAHYIPLLGHTIPAACSILFTFRTICPHCGTLQLLIGGARPPHTRK